MFLTETRISQRQALEPIVDLPRKLERLMKLARSGQGISKATLIAELWKKAEYATRLSVRLLESPSVQLRVPGRNKLIRYWNDEHNLPLTDECFFLPWDEFDKRFPLPKGAAPDAPSDTNTNSLSEFCGLYQVLRPHGFHLDRYVLEPLEILFESGTCNIRTYSHAGAKPEYLYRGEGRFANRYCSALLERKHHRHAGGLAFRTIMLYVGAQATPQRISGVIMRGVSGEAGPDQPLSMPIIALKIPNAPSLEAVEFQRGRTDDFHRIHRNSPLVVGVASNAQATVEIFEWCHTIYQKLREMTHCIKSVNDIVIHSIAPSNMALVEELSSEHWTQLVERHFQNGHAYAPSVISEADTC